MVGVNEENHSLGDCIVDRRIRQGQVVPVDRDFPLHGMRRIIIGAAVDFHSGLFQNLAAVGLGSGGFDHCAVPGQLNVISEFDAVIIGIERIQAGGICIGAGVDVHDLSIVINGVSVRDIAEGIGKFLDETVSGGEFVRRVRRSGLEHLVAFVLDRKAMPVVDQQLLSNGDGILDGGVFDGDIVPVDRYGPVDVSGIVVIGGAASGFGQQAARANGCSLCRIIRRAGGRLFPAEGRAVFEHNAVIVVQGSVPRRNLGVIGEGGLVCQGAGEGVDKFACRSHSVIGITIFSGGDGRGFAAVNTDPDRIVAAALQKPQPGGDGVGDFSLRDGAALGNRHVHRPHHHDGAVCS